MRLFQFKKLNCHGHQTPAANIIVFILLNQLLTETINIELQVKALVSVVIPFLTIWFLYLTIRYARKNTATPLPGSLGWPIVGETLDFLANFRKGVPHLFFQDRVNKYASNVFKTSLFGEAVIIFCGSEGNKFLFSNEGTLFGSWKTRSARNIFPNFKEEEVKKMKMLLLRFLKPSSTNKLIGVMDLMAKQHLDLDWVDKDHIKASSLVQKYIFSVAYQLLLGKANSDDISKLKPQFDVISDGLISMVTLVPCTSYRRAIKASRFVRKKIREVITQRKNDVKENIPIPQQNLLSDMLNSPNEEGVFEDEEVAAAMITGILLASYSTPRVVLVFLVKYLAEFPTVYNEVRKEQTEIAKSKPQGELLNLDDIQKMKYSWNVSSEVRLVPPSHGSYREAIKDFTYAGFFIPKGSKIYADSHSTHMSPNYFPDPEKFDPSRFEGKAPAPFSYVPFGGGPRLCPGMQFARFEILVFLHNLITQFKWDMLIPKEKTIFDMQPRTEHGLPIKLWACGTTT